MKNIYAAFAKNTVFANISFLIILFAGLLAATHMIKETFPEFSLDMIRIDVDYPGADPEEVEEGISLKIEEAIESVDGIKQYTTTSAEGHANVIIEVKENYDLYEVLDRVRSQVNGIATFPADAEKPIISEMLHRELVVLMSIYGDMSERRLKEWGGRLEDELKALPGISQVMTFGTRDYEISIEVSEERLRQYGLTFDQVAAAVARSNLNLAGGTIRTKDEQIRLRTVGRKYTGKDLSDIVVLAGPAGEVITLDRIATIRDDFVEDPFETTVNTKRAAFVMVYKTAEEDSIAITEAVDRYVADLKPRLPEGAEIEILFRTTDILKARMNLLIKNGILGLILVFGLLFIFLNERLSFWGGMGIPISVAGALAIIWGMGETINMISLFAFIMVLGIVVDDAIVVGEAIYVHRKNGDPPLAAAVNGVSEVGMPVVAAVTTSVAAFLPLAFVSGIMGKFIRILPIVVISCLAISLIECLLLMPAHLSHLPEIKEDDDKGKNPLIRGLNRFHARVSRGLEYFVAHIYTPFLTKALRWRYVSLCTAIAMLMLSVGLMKSGIMKFTVFPEIDGFIMAANIEFPSGTPPEVTRKAVKLVDEALIRLGEKTKTKTGEPMIKNHLTMVGLTAGEWPTIGPNFGGVQAIMLESEKRGIHSKDLMVAWEKEIGTIPGVKSITFEGMQAGPPGKPIEIWVQGYDMDEILAAADSLMKRLGKFDGVYEITSDFNPGQTELRLVLKPEARTLGLTVADLARQVNSGYFGNEAVRLQRGEEDVRIKVRYPKVRTGVFQDHQDRRHAPGHGVGQRGQQASQRKRNHGRAQWQLFPGAPPRAPGPAPHASGRTEKIAGILRQPRHRLSPGNPRHLRHHRHHVPLLCPAADHHVHRAFRHHRRGARPFVSRLRSGHHERVRHGGPGWRGGQRRHCAHRTYQRKPCRRHGLFRRRHPGRRAALPGHFPYHRKHGWRADAADSGNRPPGKIHDPHGHLPGCGRGVCHRADADPHPVFADHPKRHAPGGLLPQKRGMARAPRRGTRTRPPCGQAPSPAGGTTRSAPAPASGCGAHVASAIQGSLGGRLCKPRNKSPSRII